jgi:hypothetical protein
MTAFWVILILVALAAVVWLVVRRRARGTG